MLPTFNVLLEVTLEIEDLINASQLRLISQWFTKTS